MKNIDVYRADKQEDVVGESSSRFFTIAPPFFFSGYPKLEEAVRDALEKGDGDLIVDAKVYQKGWTAAVIGKLQLEVHGTVIKTKKVSE